MSDYDPVLVTAGDAPVTLAEFKVHARIDGTDEDSLIQSVYLPAARAYVEKWSGRQSTESTWSQQFDAFETTLLLGVSPISAIDEVTYIDANGASQTVTSSNYTLVNGSSGSPALRFIDDYTFPTVRDQVPVLTVEMTAGYADTAPEASIAKACVLLTAGDLYLNREAQSEGEMKPNAMVSMLLGLIRTKWMA